MIVVSNTSPIINLGAIGLAHLLRELFGEILIPLAVREEIAELKRTEARFSHVDIPAFIKTVPLEKEPRFTTKNCGLHRGEVEALSLAAEINAGYLLLDERNARLVARRSLPIRITGCLGILIEAKKRRLIPQVRPHLKSLSKDAGFWIGSDLRTEILVAAGE